MRACHSHNPYAVVLLYDFLSAPWVVQCAGTNQKKFQHFTTCRAAHAPERRELGCAGGTRRWRSATLTLNGHGTEMHSILMLCCLLCATRSTFGMVVGAKRHGAFNKMCVLYLCIGNMWHATMMRFLCVAKHSQTITSLTPHI